MDFKCLLNNINMYKAICNENCPYSLKKGYSLQTNLACSTIEGVKEDVLEILLNLKEVVLKSDISSTQIGKVRIQGPVILTAGMFELPPEISVIDPRVVVKKN